MTTKVLIIGAGPSGASCAIRLMQAGIDCLLIDRQQFPRPKLCAGLFTHKSQDALRYLVQEENYNNCMNQTVTSHESKFRLFKDPHHLMVECTPDEPVTLVDRQEFDQWLVNHYIGLGGQQRFRFFSRVCLKHLKASLFKIKLQDFPNVRFVINDQYFHGLEFLQDKFNYISSSDKAFSSR